MQATVAALTCSLPGTYAAATDHVWLIGGGYDAFNNQAQIEANVRLARQVLTRLPGDRQLRVYFGSGGESARDVVEWRAPAETAGALQPLARVFDSYWDNGLRFRHHRLGELAGGTRAADLIPALRSGVAALRPPDTAFLSFSGHGSRGESSAEDNAIQLWGNSRATVGDLQSVLDQAVPDVPVRFLFTQCYAGAFSALARGRANRCGFLAESWDEPAEGCSAALELNDYQDYGALFYAALARRAPTGERLPQTADRDGDGRINPREAHLHVLAAGRSSDLPRSTSEVFLLNWLPWYLSAVAGWLPDAGENEYGDLTTLLARREGLDPEAPMERQLSLKREELERHVTGLYGEQDDALALIGKTRRRLRELLLQQWPELRSPYTLGYKRFLERDLDATQNFIAEHPDYPTMVDAQDRYWGLEKRLLDSERSLTQLRKLSHLQRLADAHTLLTRFGSAASQARYRSLVACEELPL